MREINKEYERRTCPKEPRCICTNGIKRALGIISPSLLMIEQTKGNKAVAEYMLETRKYLNYMRATTKGQWRAFYRELRKARAGKCTEI